MPSTTMVASTSVGRLFHDEPLGGERRNHPGQRVRVFVEGDSYAARRRTSKATGSRGLSRIVSS
jgi:hypothetical protein